MDMMVVSTDYLYQCDNRYVRVKIGVISSVAMVQFFVDDSLVYYKTTEDMDKQYTLDIQLIRAVVDYMEQDRGRWLSNSAEDCKWLIANYDRLASLNRVGHYKFTFDGVETKLNMSVTEDWDGKVRMSIQNDGVSNRILVDFNTMNGLEIVTSLQDYIKALSGMVGLFTDESAGIRTAGFSKHEA